MQVSNRKEDFAQVPTHSSARLSGSYYGVKKRGRTGVRKPLGCFPIWGFFEDFVRGEPGKVSQVSVRERAFGGEQNQLSMRVCNAFTIRM